MAGYVVNALHGNNHRIPWDVFMTQESWRVWSGTTLSADLPDDVFWKIISDVVVNRICSLVTQYIFIVKTKQRVSRWWQENISWKPPSSWAPGGRGECEKDWEHDRDGQLHSSRTTDTGTDAGTLTTTHLLHHKSLTGERSHVCYEPLDNKIQIFIYIFFKIKIR